jgi:hypothetical protein
MMCSSIIVLYTELLELKFTFVEDRYHKFGMLIRKFPLIHRTTSLCDQNYVYDDEKARQSTTDRVHFALEEREKARQNHRRHTRKDIRKRDIKSNNQHAKVE